MSRVQSIERAFAVLSALADGPIGVTEVAQRVRVPKSTAARLLTALRARRRRRAGGGRDALPARARGSPTWRPVTSRRGTWSGVARPHLVELATAAGEVAGLSVPDGGSSTTSTRSARAHEVQVRDWTGSRVPMHAVPSGQVMLAGLAPAALERFLATPLESFTPATVVDPEALRERLREYPPRRVCLGPRRVQRGACVGCGAGGGRRRRGARRRSRPRPVVPLPGIRYARARDGARHSGRGADLRRAPVDPTAITPASVGYSNWIESTICWISCSTFGFGPAWSVWMTYS